MAGVQEGNPLVRRLSGDDLGLGSFVVLGLISVALFFMAYWVPKPAVAWLAIPSSLMALGAVVTARNARIIRRRA